MFTYNWMVTVNAHGHIIRGLAFVFTRNSYRNTTKHEMLLIHQFNRNLITVISAMCNCSFYYFFFVLRHLLSLWHDKIVIQFFILHLIKINCLSNSALTLQIKYQYLQLLIFDKSNQCNTERKELIEEIGLSLKFFTITCLVPSKFPMYASSICSKEK